MKTFFSMAVAGAVIFSSFSVAQAAPQPKPAVAKGSPVTSVSRSRQQNYMKQYYRQPAKAQRPAGKSGAATNARR